jgi:hypothetical protein
VTDESAAGLPLTVAQTAFTLPAMGSTSARLTVLASSGSGLVRTLAEVPPGTRHTGAASAGGELWFVVEGSGRLGVDGVPGPALTPERGLWIPPRSGYQVDCDSSGGLRLDLVALPATSARTASPGISHASQPLSRDLRDCPAETTGDRTFRVLFGPDRDCAAATQFVGEIPPGRAPEHSHP